MTNRSVPVLTAILLISAVIGFASAPLGNSAAARSGGWGGLSCNLVADAKDDPECAAYLKNKSQDLTSKQRPQTVPPNRQ
jgi:hypothetical protein